MKKNAIKVTMTVAVFLVCVAVVSAIDVVFPSSGGAADAIWTNNSDTIYPELPGDWYVRSIQFRLGDDADTVNDFTEIDKYSLSVSDESTFFTFGDISSPFNRWISYGNWSIRQDQTNLGKVVTEGMNINITTGYNKGGNVEVGRNARILGNATIDDTTYIHDADIANKLTIDAAANMEMDCGSNHPILNFTGNTMVLQCVS